MSYSTLEKEIITLSKEKKIIMVLAYKKENYRKKLLICYGLIFLNKELVSMNLAEISLFKNELYYFDRVAKTNQYFQSSKYNEEVHLKFKNNCGKTTYLNFSEARTISKLIYDNIPPSSYTKEFRSSKDCSDEFLLKFMNDNELIESL